MDEVTAKDNPMNRSTLLRRLLRSAPLAAVCLLFCSPASAVEWQQHISEEGGAMAICKRGLMTGIHCTGKYCDNVSVGCTTQPRLGRTTSWTPWHSEENKALMCGDGYFISKLKCQGRYCDNISAQCTQAAGKALNCHWLNNGAWVSEEGSGRLAISQPRTFVRGIQCSGKYCDAKKLYVCSVPKVSITKIDPRWALVDTCAGQNCALTRSVSVGISNEVRKIKGEEWSSTLTASVETTVGGEAAGGSVKVGFSASFSESQRRELQKAVTTKTTQMTATNCGQNGKGQTKALYQYQYAVYEDCVSGGQCSPAIVGGTSTVCVVDPPNGAANFRPICAPGCCKNGLCTQCHTTGMCQGSPKGLPAPPQPPVVAEMPDEEAPMTEPEAPMLEDEEDEEDDALYEDDEAFYDDE
jgi:hypothetical protein